MFLVHNIHIWCRVFYFCYGYVGVFQDTLYTNSILTSGLILFSAVLGVSAHMLFLGYVALSILFYFAIVQPNQVEPARFVDEYTRDLLADKKAYETWIKERERLAKLVENNEPTDQKRAKQVFEDLDRNKNNSLDAEEVNTLLKKWNVAESCVKRFKNDSKTNSMSFEVFYRNLWRLDNTSACNIEQGTKCEGMVKARFVFDVLDSNSSGYIDTLELEKLLIQCGLPENEVEAYLASDEDKRYSFDEFYQSLKLIWDFAYENMLISNVAQDMHTGNHRHSE